MVDYIAGMGAKHSTGDEWVMSCPFCGKVGHLYVNTKPRGKKLAGRWTCFRCDEGSQWLTGLIMQLESCSFTEAKMAFSKLKIGGVRFRKISEATESARPSETDEAIPDPASVAEGRRKLAALRDSLRGLPVVEDDWVTPMVKAASVAPPWEGDRPSIYIPVWNGRTYRLPKYLKQRGITPERAREYQMGWCQDGRYADRIIMPIDAPDGRSFAARSVDKSVNIRYLGGPGAGELMYGWPSVRDREHVVIVEGPFDVLRVVQAGYQCLGIQGHSLRESQLQVLQRYRFETISLMVDPEVIMDHTTTRTGRDPLDDRERKRRKLPGESIMGVAKKLPGNVRIALLRGAKDPGEASHEQIHVALHCSKSRDDVRTSFIAGALDGLRRRLSK